MTDPNDRRQFWRAHFRADAMLQAGPVAWPCRLEDISLKGALLEMPDGAELTVGESCRLVLDLASGAAIAMQGTIAHVDRRHAGLRCDSIDVDSVTHLRRLVELNAGDAGVFERDLATLLHDPSAAGWRPP